MLLDFKAIQGTKFSWTVEKTQNLPCPGAYLTHTTFHLLTQVTRFLLPFQNKHFLSCLAPILPFLQGDTGIFLVRVWSQCKLPKNFSMYLLLPFHE